ncbi:MAG TPA: glycosyltransferase, partial [Streptosporangiaceae bacterium]
MSLTVGILAYNSEQVLPDLLESLPDALAGVDGWHLVVVDGASTDRTAELARRTAPNATCVDLGGNRGFAAAANAAIGAFPATSAVLILSPRVRLTPGCVKVMLDALREPGTGIVVPRLF